MLALIKLAILGKIDETASHQCIIGLSFQNYNPASPSAFWAAKARFSHLRRSAINSDDSAAAGNGVPSMTPKQALRQTTTHSSTISIITEALIGKFSGVLIIPTEEINAEKAVATLGLDSLVAVEVRSWILREFEAGMTTMELMTGSSIGALAESIAGRSKLCGRFMGEGEKEGEKVKEGKDGGL